MDTTIPAVRQATGTDTAPEPTIGRVWCGLCGTYVYLGEDVPCGKDNPKFNWDACGLKGRKYEQVPVSERKAHEEQKANQAAFGNILPLSPAGVEELLNRDPDICDLEIQPKAKAIDLQVGGDHYKSMPIQPITYVMANGIPFPEGNIIKYVTRWRSKGGLKDLEKARHMLDVLIEFERERPAQEKA